MNEQQRAELERIRDVLYPATGLEDYDEEIIGRVLKDIKALLAQDALYKMAEESRTSGLRLDDWPKIGCVNHDCDKCKAVQEPVAQPLDAKENKYFSDGQEYVFESASYYARSRQLARAEQAIVKARIRLEGDCKQSLDKRTMPDWGVVNQLAVESLSYIEQYLKIETYGKSTTKDDLKAMAEINFRPPAAQPAPVKTCHDGKPWPVAPKPWVGLDEDEVEDCARGCANHAELARAIEAKLKEKNT
jgi:hypothetical protein